MRKQEGKNILYEEYLSSRTSQRKLAVKYGLSLSTVKRWLMAAKKENKGHKTQKVSQAEKLPKPAKGLPDDVQQLQEELYNAQLKISLLEAMIDISDEEFGTNIRKKPGTGQS